LAEVRFPVNSGHSLAFAVTDAQQPIAREAPALAARRRSDTLTDRAAATFGSRSSKKYTEFAAT
jgi:hypothetical protein